MTTHVLKILPKFFDLVASGEKTWELRRNDRNFQVGDTLHLRKFHPNQQEGSQYSGEQCRVEVTQISSNLEKFGVPPDMVIMSIKLKGMRERA